MDSTPAGPIDKTDQTLDALLGPVQKKVALRTLDGELAKNPLVQQLRSLDDQCLELEDQYQAEKAKINRKYQLRYAPLLEQRRLRLVQSCNDGSEARTSSATPAVPGFWRSVLQNSADFQEYIEECDEPVLDYLADVTHEPLDELGLSGFRIRFFFEANPFFSNRVLEKVYHTEVKDAFVNQGSCVKIEAPKIEWHPGKNVTVEVITKKAKGGGRTGKKTVKSKREEVSRASFFRAFFRSLGPDEELPEEELEDYDEDEDSLTDLMDMLLAGDYEEGLILRDALLPHAVRWYTGEACDDDFGDGGDDEDEDETDEEQVTCTSDGDGKGNGKSGKRKPGTRADGKLAGKIGAQEVASDCKEQ